MIALLIRDLRLAIRAGGGFGLGLAFFLLVAVLVPLGVGPEGGVLARIAPGILWVAALLACLLSLDRVFALDFEDGSLDLLATAPMPAGRCGRDQVAGALGGDGPAADTDGSRAWGLAAFARCRVLLAGGVAGDWHARACR